MLEPVTLESKKLDAYKGIAPESQIDEILRLADQLKGARVLHLNATAFGGGVAELLRSNVPLMRDIGLNAEWQVMHGADEFFRVTKALHNALQGMPIQITPHMQDLYMRYNAMNAAKFDREYDFVIIHDPQPVAIRQLMLQNGHAPAGHWIWRCHIDLTTAQPDAWEFLRPFVEAHEAAVFSMRDYVKPDLSIRKLALIPPAIDPLSRKNADMDEATVESIVEHCGVDPSRPLLVQVSRYDPWKDPIGVIDVYRLAKRLVPNLQLAMLATMAHDDPEGLEWFGKTARHAGEDPDIHLLASYTDNSQEVNAFQRAAQVVIQKSKREGFGLVVAEALWKETPVVASRVGGIPLQIRDGQDGYLVDTVEQAADRVAYLMLHPDIRSRLGRNAREHIRSNFLITRKLLDYLRLFLELKGQA